MKQAFWLFLIFALARCCIAQEDCTRTVLVSFYDQTTKDEIQTLKTDDLEVRVDDKRLPVLEASRDFDNRLLILLETQGAAKNKHLDDVVDAVTLQARQAPDGKPVAFGIFSDKAVFTKGFFSNPRERTKAIAEVMEEAGKLGKRVALWEALHEALKVFGPHQPGDTILLVADPYDDKSNLAGGSLEKELLASHTRLFMMRRLHQSRVDQDFLWNSHGYEKTLIDRMTQETGGLWSEYVPTLVRFAWAGYMVEIKLPGDMPEPHKWKVEFRGEAEHVHRHTNYYFPARFPPCSNLDAIKNPLKKEDQKSAREEKH
jgi:hypothetical protein